MDKITEIAKIALGSVITAISGFLGGMDGIMYALIAFISIDYATGAAAAAREKRLSSEIGFWGIVRKVCILVLVGVSHFIDVYVMRSGDVFRTAVALYYIGNEGISLTENIERLGVKLPAKLVDVLAQLREQK
ncbi:MAG: phage holin family protein [Ruminococcus sp.]|nr:phage holin family protein [Ruminococcus sp.]